ncbi:hypothetical protein F511_36137 [Dorcoceras hygrometricum]|uniref:Uncharacterized protein n=1 Tax=Dorcoceras hygrometricum TaxID=472368 RepID=A0A2Z7BJW0_9LAMI|nr:hypothetical protein F511_36137 [Dorcoceras hygrometricum]
MCDLNLFRSRVYTADTLSSFFVVLSSRNQLKYRFYIQNAIQINFDSVLSLSDKAGLPENPAKANTDQRSPKIGKKNEVKPQYQEHLKSNKYTVMQYSKRAMHEGYPESSVGKAQRLSCVESNPVIFRYDRSVFHHSVVVFRHDNSVGQHINISVGPFRNDGSAGRSQRTKEFSSQENQAQYISRGHSTNSPLNPSASPDHGETQQELLKSKNLSRYLTNQLKSELIQLTAYGQEAQPNLNYTTARTLKPLRSPSTRRLKSPNRYQSKDLKETSSEPPILLQTAT